MSWAEAVPNLLIGLREGLEAGLVVSILLATVRKTSAGSTAPVWLGVLGAVTVAGCFAAILTASTDALSSTAQEAVGGSLSVLAVVLVTGMVFWMRRAAAGLSTHLRAEVGRALTLGAGALTVTAFLSVGREGLETTLFLWTAAEATGGTLAPLTGAAVGLAAAVGLCWLLYRRAVRLNLGVFFSRTALALIVIAAGVLAYGLGDLQDAGLLPGHAWVAFDLSGSIDTGSWWVSLISGVTELQPRMTVLAVVAWLVYLAVTVTVFVRAGRGPTPQRSGSTAAEGTPATTETATATPAAAAPSATTTQDTEPGPGWWERLAGHRTGLVAGVLIVVPLVVAGVVIVALPSSSAAATDVTVTAKECAPDWHAAQPGRQTFTVTNHSGKTGEINLDNAGGGIVGEIETIGPGTSANLTATLGSGSYHFRCLMSGLPTRDSAAVTVRGGAGAKSAPRPVQPVSEADLEKPNRAYEHYAAGVLAEVSKHVAAVRADLGSGDLGAARRDWRAAQLAWERVGASYNSFGDAGTAVDGLPDGLAKGVHDPAFTGLHRLEYGLWHGQSARELMPVAARLAADIGTVRANLDSPDLAGDPTNLPTRAHEILEDAQRDHLSGIDDLGAGASYAETAADVQATRAVLAELAPLLQQRSPGLVATLNGKLDTLDAALRATGWRPLRQTPLARRQAVDGALGAALERLDAVPTLLEVRPAG